MLRAAVRRRCRCTPAAAAGARLCDPQRRAIIDGPSKFTDILSWKNIEKAKARDPEKVLRSGKKKTTEGYYDHTSPEGVERWREGENYANPTRGQATRAGFFTFGIAAFAVLIHMYSFIHDHLSSHGDKDFWVFVKPTIWIPLLPEQQNNFWKPEEMPPAKDLYTWESSQMRLPDSCKVNGDVAGGVGLGYVSPILDPERHKKARERLPSHHAEKYDVPFVAGDRVRFRNEGEDWHTGVIAKTRYPDGLVMSIFDTEDVGRAWNSKESWHEIEHLSPQ